jgi:DNA replication and repair protein RecF
VKIQQLALYHFKNHSQLKLDFDADITCITGNNGQGKTNVLDAIYMLSTCKSYFNAYDYQLIQHGETIASINAHFENGQAIDLQLQIEANKKKKLKKNDKFYDKLIDHIGLINVVMITPNDIELVIGHSEERRRFLDICISQTDRVYLNTLSEYNKVLDQRNAQLKLFAKHRHFDSIMLEVYDQKLIPAAEYIHQKRQEVVAILNTHFQNYYSLFASEQEQMKMVYDSDLNASDYSTLIKQSTDKDLVLERTSVGVHKDDLTFQLGEFALKKFGSQGQSKAFVIALKLAQYQFLKAHMNTQPILLLDDLFEKIDEARAQKLIDLLQTNAFGQILITDTHSQRVKKHFENGSKTIKFVSL